MTRSSKLTRLENTRRSTRRERLHQLRIETAAASALGHNGLLNSPMDISTASRPSCMLGHSASTYARRIQKQKSNRTRAKKAKRSSLVDRQLAALDFDLSTRIGNVIETTETSGSPCACWVSKKSSPVPATSSLDTHATSSTQLPELDLSLKAFPSIPQWALTGWPTFPAPSSNKEAMNLLPSQVVSEFGWPDFKRWLPSQPTLKLLPPPTFMTATELGLPNTAPRVKLPSPLLYQFPKKMAAKIASAFEIPAHEYYGPANSVITPEAIFAELPGDPLNLESNGSDINQHFDYLKLSHHSDEHSPFVAAKLPIFQETNQEIDTLSEQRLSDFDDALERSFEEDWEGCEFNLFDSPIMVANDGDTPTSDWLYLASNEGGFASISSLDSMFSSINYPPLPASLFEEEAEQVDDDQHGAIRILAEDDPYMMEVSNSAWESENDFSIPTEFWRNGSWDGKMEG